MLGFSLFTMLGIGIKGKVCQPTLNYSHVSKYFIKKESKKELFARTFHIEHD